MAIRAWFHSEGTASSFQPNQILCVEYEGTQLFAETIQVVETRRLCWVRPLLLVITPPNALTAAEWDEKEFFDLRQGVDLLCPIALFRLAWDTEVIPLIEKLDHIKENDSAGGEPTSPEVAHARLRAFIDHLWKSCPDVFQP